eukprot:232886-Amorphochlora_amoeboformis.AAC.2
MHRCSNPQSQFLGFCVQNTEDFFVNRRMGGDSLPRLPQPAGHGLPLTRLTSIRRVYDIHLV